MASRVSYKFLKHPGEGEKLPPQAVTILKHLEELCGPEGKIISRDDLVKSLDKPVGDDSNALKARQPVERVIAFYQKRLGDEGFVEVHKAAPAAKATKAEKGAAAPKGKAKVPTADATAEAMQV